MGKSDIPEIMLSCGAVQFSANDTIPVVVSFSVLGGIRDAFNEENWTKAYDKNDNTFKMKYGIKIHSGGIKKRVVGQVDTYRKASIFWTRNPKLTTSFFYSSRVYLYSIFHFERIIILIVGFGPVFFIKGISDAP